MYHSIEVYDDDLPLSAVHLLRVCFVSIDRCLSSACRPQSAADLADHASLVSTSSCEILRTVYSKGWATNHPPTQGTIDQKVALSGVSLLHILPILGRYDSRPVKGRHVASPIENLRIVLLHC